MLYLCTPKETKLLGTLLRHALPEVELAIWPQAVDNMQVRHIVAWNPPEGFFANFPRLEAVFALGAGVDRLLLRTDLPAHVVIIRLTDAGMAQQMAEYALYGVLRYQRQFDLYQQQQVEHRWTPLPPRLAHEVRISVLGLGAIGSTVATTLAGLGYSVSGWSRRPHQLTNIACHYGRQALDTLLNNTDILINVLPSTPETRGLLDHARLAQLPQGAAIINASRGDQLDLDALLERLDAKQLRFAQLDVFDMEPLATGHPLWERSDVIITPHIAAITLPDAAVAQIADNWRVMQRGGTPSGLVQRHLAY
ncbi:2-hydroxyacid dehydrogenase [Vogesella indigofera]|uniref:2-hydroxyacid dehydrogenase n=1 Tax=Vogesella indigofera TaxID=45465 RepID=UPI00234F7566|nr:glyoxylate/hydroxypyruvate reductase A [Vogesella indigofera]MDC7712355.1 glyoxylate/hydroxypyruvate reductase A [Vogesella indigofera]